MENKEIRELRKLFIKRMSADSKETNPQKREYNRPIFRNYEWRDDDEHHSCYEDMTMEMVLDKFDLAVKDMKRLEKDKK